MPVRMSEAYADPLRKVSAVSTTSRGTSVSTRIARQSERIVTVQDESTIEWSNLIFMPFHPVFRMFVLFMVFIKVILGPIQAVFPLVYCGDTMDYHPFLVFIKYTYWYGCDSLYGIDTFLHIVHRQVVDKSVRREHLPKAAHFLILDLLSLIPFHRLMEDTACPKRKLWPNVLAFNEFLVIYRVTQYFALESTHSIFKLIIGFTIVLGMCINSMTCLMLLLTANGLCPNCMKIINVYYDWRCFVSHKIQEAGRMYTTYIYASVLVLLYSIGLVVDVILPSTVSEFFLASSVLMFGYVFKSFFVIPKTLAETSLRLIKICDHHANVAKIVAETERRNSKKAAAQVLEIYKLIWTRRGGTVDAPPAFLRLPRYLRIDVKQDLLWPLFYHSPILRKTTLPFRRWLSEYVQISYRMPGEKFFTGNHSRSTLFYLKSGIVQLISLDDGTTPILSVTSGTIFGDVSSLVPHLKRKVLVRCVTYCEIYYVTRYRMILGLHKYYNDRKTILEAVEKRMEHARVLFANKSYVRGIDRNVDEGISWIKRRWWEIFHVVDNWSKLTGKAREDLQITHGLPREEDIYHCSKYLGQLVLCTPSELQTKSMFTNFKFPWILNPESRFGYAWHKIFYFTLCLVLYTYPINLIRPRIPEWFIFFSFWVDLAYAFDLGVSLCTAMKKRGNVTTTFYVLLFERFKSFTFILDLMSTIWIEDLAEIVGFSQYYFTLQFNRLIRIYRLFYGVYLKWEISKDPGLDIMRNLILTNIAVVVIMGHVVYELHSHLPSLSLHYFFGDQLCEKFPNVTCDEVSPFTGVTVLWYFEQIYNEYEPTNLTDVYAGTVVAYIGFCFATFLRCKYISYLFLRHKHITKYQQFVTAFVDFYKCYRINRDLLKRINRYLICHWKYHKGVEIIYQNSLRNEPIEVYYKAQVEVAQKIIGQCRSFQHANPLLIRELAYKAKFLILPRNAIIYSFGNQCKNVTWIVEGYVKVEQYNDNGELVPSYMTGGLMMSVCAVFFSKPSLQAYTAYTECEVLYIPVNDFIEVYKRFKFEYSFLITCKTEYGPEFDTMFRNNVLKHKDYQSAMRSRIQSTRMSMMTTSKVLVGFEENRSLPFEGIFWGEPETRFLRAWLVFRTVIVGLSIMSASCLGGIGAVFRWTFAKISAFCDCIAWIDIIIKLFLYYYDHRGILITSKRKCFFNYISKGFILDIIGVVPVYQIIQLFMTQTISIDNCLLMNTICRFAHIYILFACFEYVGDLPTVNIAYIMILKWQIVNILIVFGASHYLMVNCVNFVFDEDMELIDIQRRNDCWMPKYLHQPTKLNPSQLHLIFAESLSLAESGMMKMNFGRFIINRENLGVGMLLIGIGLIIWFISCFSVTLLVLSYQGDVAYRQDVYHLETFLTSERVEKKLIQRVIAHLRYYWLRTKGSNVQEMMTDRVGILFRQDINYSFYHKTFIILDTILGGGEMMQRNLAGAAIQGFFLPDYDIFREMDLVSNVCIVHRGRVHIWQQGKRLIVLSKGDIFGQLQGTKLRPIRVTATSAEMVDLLYIDVQMFQSIITDKIRETIAKNPQHKKDFLATAKLYIENPYDTVQYLIRGCKTIKLPWSKAPCENRNRTWYSRWLFLTWFIGPCASSIIVLNFTLLPEWSILWFRFYIVLYVLDIIHLAQMVSEFLTIELVVENKKLKYKHIGLQQFKSTGFYIDFLTILLPLMTFIDNDWRFQLARLLRLRHLIDFRHHFCMKFRNSVVYAVFKLTIVVLLMHFFTCGWIIVACRHDTFPIENINKTIMESSKSIEEAEWFHTGSRKGGCARVTKDMPNSIGELVPGFVVPKYWPYDYLVALTYIILIHTHTDVDVVMAVTIEEVYYKCAVTYCLHLLDLWILAAAINYVNQLLHELYTYDYAVRNLLEYLSSCGLCASIKDSVSDYTSLVWKRQKGEFLPELAYQLPPCLRHDVFSALYAHHLEAPPSFREMPDYFKRQLCARLRRVVIFPGKCIVREGDTFTTTYFVHQGELEKWYNDASGEGKLLSVLYTNGYFGCITGLFPNRKNEFTYYARTVVDLVHLDLDNWRDLLAAYPDLKAVLYNATREIRQEYARENYGKGKSFSA